MGRFDSYSGLVTAYPYAFRQSDSLLFRSYVVVSGLLGFIFTFIMTGALIVLVANTTGTGGGSLTLSRTFYVVVGLFIFVPLVAPVLFVANRYRRNRQVAERYDTALSVAGYVFVLSVYLGIAASMPASFQTDAEVVTGPLSGLLAPIVELIYAIPSLASPLFVLAGALVVYGVHRHYRSQ